MKRLLLAILLLALLCCPAYAIDNNFYWRNCLSGAGCLDAIDGSGLTAGDTAWVPYNNSGTGEGYKYLLIDDSASADSPRVIVPSTNPGTHRWHLTKEVGDGFSVPKTANTAGQVLLYDDYGTEAYGDIWEGSHQTGALGANRIYQMPTAAPLGGQVMIFPTPTATRSTATWGDPVLVGGSGYGGLIFGDSSPDAAGEIGYDGALKYYNTASRTVVSLDETQTLSAKTLTAPKETVVAGGTCSTSYAPDLSSGTMFTLTVSGGACSLSNPTNLAAGMSYIVKVSHSDTSAFSVGGNLYKWPGGTVPTWTNTASAIDILACISFDGSTLQCQGQVDIK